MDLVIDQRLRKRTAVMLGCWFLSYAVFNLTTLRVFHTNRYARLILPALKLTGVLLGVPIIMRAGRRRTLGFSMGALSVLSLAQALIHVLRAPDHLLAGVVVSSMLVFDMCLIALYLFSAELYPTVVRVTGLAFGYASGRLGTLVSAFVADIDQAGLKGAAYGVVAALQLYLAVMAMGLPETTRMQPANTMRDMEASRWALREPLRVARGTTQGNVKRKRHRGPSRERSNSPRGSEKATR